MESLKVINCFRPNLLPATIQSYGLQLIHGLPYIYYAVWFTSLNDTKISVSSKTLQKVWRVYGVLNAVMIPQLGGCRSEVVMVDRYSPWVFIWAGTSCRHLSALSRMRRTLNARLLDFKYSFQRSLYMHGLLPITALQANNHFLVASFSHRRPFLYFWERGHKYLQNKCLNWMEHRLYCFCWCCLHLSWWNKLLVQFHHNGIWSQQCSFPSPPYATTPWPTVTLISFYFYP